jgi:hypothetical protein
VCHRCGKKFPLLIASIVAALALAFLAGRGLAPQPTASPVTAAPASAVIAEAAPAARGAEEVSGLVENQLLATVDRAYVKNRMDGSQFIIGSLKDAQREGRITMAEYERYVAMNGRYLRAAREALEAEQKMWTKQGSVQR